MGDGFGSSPVEMMARDAMLAGLVFCDFYTLPANWLENTPTALLANQSLPIAVQVGSSGDFVIQEFQLVAKQSGSLSATPDLLVDMVEDTSDRKLFGTPTHVLNVFGRYGQNNVPGVLRYPKLLQANSSLSITLTDLSGTNWNRIYMALKGFRVYYQGGTREQVFHAL